jgi:hypothetical protein
MPIAESAPPDTSFRWFRRSLRTVAALAALSLAAGILFRPAIVGVSAIALAGASLMIVISGLGRTRAAVVGETEDATREAIDERREEMRRDGRAEPK